MSFKSERLKVYPAPNDAIKNNDFTVRVRQNGGEWQELFSYMVKVDMHNVREASMVYFDFSGTVEIEVTKNSGLVNSIQIRPASFGIEYNKNDNKVCFKLSQSRKISFEVNGDRYHNLHIFANAIEEDIPNTESPELIYVEPGTHCTEEIIKRISSEANLIYFAPGMHYFDEPTIRVPSGKNVYIAGGAMVEACFLCDNAENITIRGRGIQYLGNYERTTWLKAVIINYSRNIRVEGIITVAPPQCTVLIGVSQNVILRDIKSFSIEGWSDGIDCYCCTDILIDDVFLRNSDDCVAVYGRRWQYNGESRRIRVTNSVLWADVAHPLMIGVHGDYENDGNIFEDIRFENIDILEHHEPQMNYLGCMTINVGDKNRVKNVSYENIRVEQFESGRLFDIRVFHNEKYNPAPGNRIENVYFKDIVYNGAGEYPAQIMGFDSERVVDGVTIENLVINGKHILGAESGNINIGEFAYNITFK